MAENSLLHTVQAQSGVGQPASYQTILSVVPAVKAIGVLGLGIFRSVTPHFRTQLRSYEICYENMSNYLSSITGWGEKFVSFSRSRFRF
jgi:hypothetical protein